SMLLPMITKVRRAPAVLASPIAYATGDGAIYLVHPAGKTQIDIAPPGTLCWNSWPEGPTWSPNGRWIGHTIHITGELHYIAIVEATTGKVHRYDSVSGHPDQFIGWVDNDHFIERSSSGTIGFYIRDAENGKVTQTYPAQAWIDQQVQISVAPPNSGAAYVT